MEKFSNHEQRSPFFKHGLIALGIGTGVLTIAGCYSQPVETDKTTTTTLSLAGENDSYIQLDDSEVRIMEFDNVIDANGDPLHCVRINQGTYRDSTMSLDCDFSGEATFSGEPGLAGN